MTLECLGDKPTVVFYGIRDKKVATLRLDEPPFTRTGTPGVVIMRLKDKDFLVKKRVPRYAILTATNGDPVYRCTISSGSCSGGADINLLGKPVRGCTISIDYFTLTLAS